MRINGAQSVKLWERTIELKNLFKQIQVPFKIYFDFECILTSVESYEGSCSKKYQDHVPRSFAYKIVCANDGFSKPIIFTEVKILLINLLKQFLKSMNTVKKWWKKYFNKNLIMTEKEEEKLQSSNMFWICEKLIEDEKVRDHCHVTAKFRGTAYWSCNINLQLTKKVPVIFYNWRGYDSN